MLVSGQQDFGDWTDLVLSWNEIRKRAASFAREWKDAAYEKGETHSFYNDFFRVFGVKRRKVARYEQHVAKLNKASGYIDLLWPGQLIVEQKSAGHDLKKAYEQAGEYFDGLLESEQPRYILVSDFQTFELHDLDERTVKEFVLVDLPENVEAFGFILGVHPRKFRDQDPANIKAAELVGKLHDSLLQTGYQGHDLEVLLVRIAFCLFADDTGIFDPRDIFLDFIEQRTSEDGADLGPWLSQLFQVLDTPMDKRLANLDEALAQFPYVNGRLFAGPLRIPAFDATMRQALLDACHFNWSNISPAIFGALFQSVMNPEQRRAQGAHYTTEKNILKIIEPLFMDDLRDEFQRLKMRKDNRRAADLRAFQRKLGEMSFFDPACGCGNFLVITYRELRLLEIEVIKELRQTGDIELFDVASLSLIDVDQFYGIEINEFPVRIAETALWMMDHIMNNLLSQECGHTYARIPLESSPSIIHGDALEMDWTNVLSPDKCSHVLGNPPFGGAKFQSADQRAQVRRIAKLGGSGGSLDYVSAWFIKAGEYVQGEKSRIGFVATNSITQGEQVAQLWPVLFNRCELELAFAHRTFAWGSDARGKAHVHVVILGLARRRDVRPASRLFSYPDINGDPDESQHRSLLPYLIDASGLDDPHLSVREESKPINGFRPLIMGSQPIDNGQYIFNQEKLAEFLGSEPDAQPFFRPFVGAREHLQGGKRWILCLHDASPDVLAGLPLVKERIANVRAFRKKSKRRSTRVLSDTPMIYQANVLPTRPYLAVPETSSEKREYVPIGWLEPPTIPSNALRILVDATLTEFALLTSAMHMSWLRYIGGRLKSDYRYSIGLVYNTFPTPPEFSRDESKLPKLAELAKEVLHARTIHANSTLANLYDPDVMPSNLRKAHQALDRAVDRLYRTRRFDSERERVEYLFTLYEKIRMPLSSDVKPKRKRRKIYTKSKGA